MPHANMPEPGFQAVILCGPGVSLNTFTSNPKDFPKCLIPIANRPMVWYPLEWCYRMGITTIHLITPPESAPALESALATNPYLTSLPSPKPDIIAPNDLTQTSGTGEILRFPEVRKIIAKDFLVLPCDIICEVDGSSFLETWMIEQASLGGGSATFNSNAASKVDSTLNGRRGGLSIWYPTKVEDGIKKEETDFLITTALPPPVVPPPASSLEPHLSQVLLSMPTDTLKDTMEEKNALRLRRQLVRKHARIRMHTSYRDAHIYFFPSWVMDLVSQNDTFDSISEDVLGWWSKAVWQDGLADKMSLRTILSGSSASGTTNGVSSLTTSFNTDTNNLLDNEVDLASLCSTSITPHTPSIGACDASPSLKPSFATRVSSSTSPTSPTSTSQTPLTIPALHAYLHPIQQNKNHPLIRRVDTPTALLQTSLYLATLPPTHPFAHPEPIAYPEGILQPSRIETGDCLLDANVSVGERANVKASIIGARCVIAASARLVRCVLFEGATVGEGVQLTGCIVGRRAKIEGPAKGIKSVKQGEDRTKLTDCEVADGFVVPWGTEAKGEKFTVFDVGDDEEGFTLGDDEGQGEEMDLGT